MNAPRTDRCVLPRHATSPTAKAVLLALACVAAAALTPPAHATEARPNVQRAATLTPALDRAWSVGAYGSAWRGSYDGVGTGTILRWRFWPGSLGVEVFATQASVAWPDADRSDYTGGFAVTTPFRLHSRLEANVGLGFCGMISRIDPTFFGGPRNDATLLGAHASANVQWAASRWVSVFIGARAFAYHGVDRRIATPTGRGELRVQPSLQADAGLSFHFGG